VESLHKTINHAAAPTIHIDPACDGMPNLEFSFAFQPIVDTTRRKVISFEALVRGPHGEPASDVFACVPPEDLSGFDHACRLKAIRLAARLKLHTSLNLNFLPNSIQHGSKYLYATLQASIDAGFPAERLVFEVSEMSHLYPPGDGKDLFNTYAVLGFQTAIDDFGTGFSGLYSLVDYRPDYVKLDRNLIADIHTHRAKQIIVSGVLTICSQLSITPVAEGVEKVEEYRWLSQAGIHIFQGHYFAHPTFEALADVRPAMF
jgi:EAL domain-containing protein (putative c-di-GMP-specific phosphodiesterase class I)